jgi:hypothetical protein
MSLPTNPNCLTDGPQWRNPQISPSCRLPRAWGQLKGILATMMFFHCFGYNAGWMLALMK